MSRQPIDELRAGGRPEPRQAIWGAIRRADAQDLAVTAAGLAHDLDLHSRTVTSYLSALEAAGYVLSDRAEDEAARHHRYHLVRDTGVHAPRLRSDGRPVTQGAGTENMWRSMRMLPSFSPRDLAVHSTTETCRVSEDTAKAYCKMLLATGYLRVLRKAVPGRAQAVYRLVRNSGGLPPMIQRVQQVFDPNTGTVHRPEREA